MKPIRLSAFALALFFSGVAAAAEPTLQPVPVPDLSRFPQATADALRKERASFDNVSKNVSGDALVETYSLLASAYARAGLYNEAAVALEDAARLAPDNGIWPYAQGVVAHLQKRDEDARALFTRAFSLSPDYLPVRVALVNLRVQAGDLVGARNLLTEYTQRHPGVAVPFVLLGEIAMKEKRYADASDAFDTALKLDPKATKVYAQLADAYEGSGNAKAAADARAKAGNGVPALADPVGLRFSGPAPAAKPAENTDPLMQAAAEANMALAARQYDKARSLADRALKLRPNDPTLLALYARIEGAAGNLPQARARADAAVAAGPDNALAFANLGIVLEMANDDVGAQRAYDKAIALDAGLVEPHIRRGNYLMRAGRLDDASAAYREVVKGDPKDTAGWVHLVAAEVAAGRCASVLKDINSALAKDSKNGFLLQLFVRLTSTCPGVGAGERKMALDYAQAMYQQVDAAPVGEAYALALAANGQWDNAVKTQQAAMFVLLKNNKRDEIGDYREFMQAFQAHKLPDRPWPPGHVLFHPQRAAPDPKPVAAAARK
ncbi:tetratricopeptide repeat protein [Dokdonella sp.]|uniref:tetratricopeptide repeat protein n=1 Tax=Dokdonella sp. TaxID=2291710 RepID=UPI003784B027